MATTVDNRVVEMQFNNRDFERNVDQSIGTLDRLEKALNFASAERTFGSLEKSANSISFSNLAKNVESLSDRFSVMGIASMQVITRLTDFTIDAAKKVASAIVAPIEIAKQKGWARAMNIENAKFQLEGLGIAWKDVSDSIDYAVSGTAYGLDEAAKAAGQLAASGVSLGDDMSTALRAISGTAAMANTSYDEMAAIFEAAAGKGRVMGTELTRLSQRGVGAAKILGDYLGKTEGEVREMASKSQISFDVFAKAMDEAFGEHAKDANKTFQGSLSNIYAALGRLGAKFQTPIIQNAVEVFNALRVAINNISATLDPYAEVFSKIVIITTHFASKVISSTHITETFINVVDTLRNIFIGILNILDPIMTAFENIFPAKTLSDLANFTKKIEEFTSDLYIGDKNTENLRKTFEGLFSIVSLLGDAFTSFIQVFLPIGNDVGDVGSKFLEFTGTLGDYIKNVVETTKENETFKKSFESVYNFLRPIFDGIKDIVMAVIDVLINLVNTEVEPPDITNLSEFGKKVREILNPVIDVVHGIGGAVGGLIEILEGIYPIFVDLVQGIGEYIGKLKDKIVEFLEAADVKTAKKILNYVIIAATLYQAFKKIGDAIKFVQNIGKILNPFQGIIDSVTGALNAFQNKVKYDSVLKIAEAIALLAGSLVLVSSIPPDNLLQASLAMAGLIAALQLTVKLIKDFSKDKDVSLKALAGLAAAMMSISIAVGILSLSMKSLSSLSWPEVLKGLVGVGGLLLELYGTLWALSKIDKEVKQSAVLLIGIAVAVRVLASAVEKLGNLGDETMNRGLTGLVAVLASLWAFLQFAKLDKLGVKAGIGLMAIAAAIFIIAPALKTMSEITLDGSLVSALIGLAAAFVGLAATSAALKKFGSIGPIAGIGLMAIAASVRILVPAIKELSEMAGDGSDGDKLVQGLKALGIVLLELAAATIFMQNGIAGAIAIGILSLSLRGILPVLEQLSNIEWTTLLSSLGKLAVVIAGLGVVAVITTVLAPAFMALTLVLTAIGIPLSLVTIALGLLGIAITKLASVSTTEMDKITAMLPTIVENIGNTIIGVIKMLGDAATEIGVSVTKIVLAVVRTIADSAIEIGTQVVRVITEVLKVIAENAPSIAQSVTEIIVSIVNTISSNAEMIVGAVIDLVGNVIIAVIHKIPDILKVVVEAFSEVINTIEGYFPGFKDAGADIIRALIDGIKSLLTGVGGLFEAACNVGTTILNGISSTIGSIVDGGKEIVNGLVNTINGSVDEAYTAGENLSGAVDDGMRDRVGAHSEADEAIDVADDIVNGVVNETERRLDEAYTAGGDLGETLVEGVGDKALDKVDEVMPEVDSKVMSYVNDTGSKVQQNVSRWTSWLKTFDGKILNTKAAIAESEKAGFKSIGDFRMLENGVKTLGTETKETKTEFDGLGSSVGKASKAGSGGTKTAKEAKEEVKKLWNTMESGKPVLETIAKKFEKTSDISFRNATVTVSLIQNNLEKSGAIFKDTFNKMLQDTAKSVDGIGDYMSMLGSDDILDFDAFEKLRKSTNEGLELIASDYKQLYDEIVKDFSTKALDNFAEHILITSDKYTDEIKKMDKNSEEYLEAMQAAWEDFTKEIEDAFKMDVFSENERQFSASITDMTKTIKNNQTLVEDYGKTFDRLSLRFAKEKWDPAILKQWALEGYASFDKIAGAFQATRAEMQEMMDSYKRTDELAKGLANTITADLVLSFGEATNLMKSFDDQSVSFGIAMQDMASITEDMSVIIKNRYEEMYEAMKKTLDAQINIFEEYSDSEEEALDPEDLIKYADSQVAHERKLEASWDRLLQKNPSQELVKKLIEMGDEGNKYVDAIGRMTEEQVERYYSKIEEIATIKEEASQRIATRYAVAGEEAINAFVDRIDPSGAVENMDKVVREAVNKGIELAPLAYGPGQKVAESLADGIIKNEKLTNDASKDMGGKIITTLQDSMKEKDLKNIGLYIDKGLASGIDEHSVIVTSAVKKLMSQVKKEAEDAVEEKSPSKWAMRVGRYIDQGLAFGIEDGTKEAVDSIADLGYESISAMEKVIDHIYDIVTGDINIDPTIRPAVDMSDIDAALPYINGVFADRSMQLTRGLGGIRTYNGNYNGESVAQNGNSTTQNITMNVYGAEGQDVDELATIISHKLSREVSRYIG